MKRPDSDGDYPYYSNYTGRADKEYYVAKWPCCSGTLIQTVGDYPLNLAFTTKSGLHINFYTPSTINFNYGETPITLRQETHFPASDTVAITLDMPHNVACTLALRIPAWVSGHATIALNGKQLATGTPGNWLSLKRTWSSGDTLTLTLPQAFRLESIDDQHPDTVALMRGPVQYVALNAPGNFTRLSAAVGDLRQAAPQVYTDASGLTYVPLYLTGNDVYTSYFSRK